MAPWSQKLASISPNTSLFSIGFTWIQLDSIWSFEDTKLHRIILCFTEYLSSFFTTSQYLRAGCATERCHENEFCRQFESIGEKRKSLTRAKRKNSHMARLELQRLELAEHLAGKGNAPKARPPRSRSLFLGVQRGRFFGGRRGS